jgi:dolichol-phosphate mannosyltransferase
MKIKKILNDTKIDINQKWLNRYELEVYLLYNVYLSSYYSKKEVPITITYHKEKTDYSKMKMIIDWWRILRPIIFLKFNIKK